MIRTKTTVNGSEFVDYRNLSVTKAVSDNNTVSSYELTFDSPFGRHKNDFTVGNEVKIYADKDATPTTNIFTGIVDNINFIGEGLDEKVTLRGRDYSARLIDNNVEPVVYTNTEIGSITRDIISNNLSDIGSSNINSTSTVLKRIAFNQTSIFEATKQLADLAGYYFYVDNNKDLNFVQSENTPANVTFNSGNIIYASFDKTRENMANKIWVYGDRYLSGFREKLNVGSPNVGGLGSVFTLQYKPHSVSVEILGSSIKGGIYQMAIDTSGLGYLVNYEDRQLIFPSGTSLGYFLPPSGGSIVASYDRDLPVVKYGEDRNSINLFGPKTLLITDKSIRDPNTAVSIVRDKLNLANPLNNIELSLKGWFTFVPGQTANISLPNFNLSASGLTIIEQRYDFDINKCTTEEVLTVKLDQRKVDITDKIRDINNRLELLESADKTSSDIITRLENGTGSVFIVGSRWQMQSRLMNNSFLDSHNSNGRLGKLDNYYIGSLSNDPVFYSGNNPNYSYKSLSFNGTNQFVVIPSGLLLQAYDPCTLMFFMKVNDWATSVNPRLLQFTAPAVGGSNHFLVGYYGYANNSSGLIAFQHYSGTNYTGRWVSPSNNKRINKNDWTHFAYTVSGVGGSIYLDGSVMLVNTNPGYAILNSSGTLHLGGPFTSSYSGLIDSLKIYNRVLTPGEIGSSYNGIDIAGSLLFYYRFDEGIGSQIFNSVMNGSPYNQSFLGDRRSLGSIIRSGGYY